jgi:putative modified peptide
LIESNHQENTMSMTFDSNPSILIDAAVAVAEPKPTTATNKFPREVAERLLDKLSSDDSFRALFLDDARAAMAAIGYETPAAYAGVPGSDPIMCCLEVRSLAPKQVLAAARQELATRLSTSIFAYDIGV